MISLYKEINDDKFDKSTVYSLDDHQGISKAIQAQSGEIINDNLMWFPAENAKRTVVVIPGGPAKFYVSKRGTFPENQLMPGTSIPHFRNQGYNVAYVHAGNVQIPWLLNVLYARAPWLALRNKIQPVPKEWLKEHTGMELKTALHAIDTINKTIRTAIRLSTVPTLLIGQCNSNWLISTYYHTLHKTDPCCGLIFTSVNSPPTRNRAFYERCNFFIKDTTVSIPVHVIHHRYDVSNNTGPDIAEIITKQYDFDDVTLTIMEGGINEGHPKLTYGYHGARGIEKEFVQTVVDWANLR